MNIRFENGTEIAALSKTASEAIWTPPESFWHRFYSLGSILELMFDPGGAHFEGSGGRFPGAHFRSTGAAGNQAPKRAHMQNMECSLVETVFF